MWGLKNTEAGPCTLNNKEFALICENITDFKACTNPVGVRIVEGFGLGLFGALLLNSCKGVRTVAVVAVKLYHVL